MERKIGLILIKRAPSDAAFSSLLVIFLTLGIFPSLISAQTFDQNSATLTNAYLPMKVGYKLTFTSYGFIDLNYTYIEGINQETIDQVKCLRIKVSIFNILSQSSTVIYYFWLAQDTSGNVWIFQYLDAELNDFQYFGKNNAKLAMPSIVNVGSSLWDGNELVVATGITVAQLSTGLGPYYNCIKSKIDYGDGDIDYIYYAPNVGEVKEEWNDDGGINGSEISKVFNRPISLSFLQLLLE